MAARDTPPPESPPTDNPIVDQLWGALDELDAAVARVRQALDRERTARRPDLHKKEGP